MKKNKNFVLSSIRYALKKYPLSLLCIAMVWILSLVPFFPETPLDDVPFIDKWTHLVMYGGTCSVIWFEYWRNHRHNAPLGRRTLATSGTQECSMFNFQCSMFRSPLLWAWLAPILMSGLLELLQAYCTTTRNGDWLDFAANSLGATLALPVGLLLRRLH